MLQEPQISFKLFVSMVLADVLNKYLRDFNNQVGEENWERFSDQFPPQLKEKLPSQLLTQVAVKL
jgi:hypothetical protein